jgi:hypothetical protein
MNRKTWVLVGLGALAVAALACLVGFGLFFQPLIPTRLDVDIHEPSTDYATQAGSYAITLTLRPQGDDNGPVLIDVTSNGQNVGQFESIYNYDLFSNEPAGEMWHTWVDDDVWRDVVISTPLDGKYYISSRDGKLYALPEN